MPYNIEGKNWGINDYYSIGHTRQSVALRLHTGVGDRHD